MDRIWAPWRLEYVSAPMIPTDAAACFLCRGVESNDDRANLIAYRTSQSVVMLNRYPYNNGHLLVAPLAHKAALSDLNDRELLDLQHVLQSLTMRLSELITPDGFNIGLNLGRVSGAGLLGHLHWHIVPRWNGDTNFMPVIGDTKVISQSLEALYELLVSRIEPRKA